MCHLHTGLASHQCRADPRLQAKAGRVHAAFAAVALMEQHGHKVNVRHHTMLINACARARPPQVQRAETQFEELLLLGARA